MVARIGVKRRWVSARRRQPWWLMVALSLVIACAYSLNPSPAHANPTPPSPASLLNPFIDGGDGIYSATDAQYASLVNFENQAVQNTLSDHGLASGDAAAAQTWGRSDALAELWALILDAIIEPACATNQTPGNNCRTADQQNVVDWLTAVYQRDAIQAAEDAGLEYVKWAGLDESGYQTMLAGNPSHDTIKNFLYQGFEPGPLNYSGIVSTCPTSGTCVNYGGSNYTEGYCVYQPPSPFQNDYSDRSALDCLDPCPPTTSCTPLGPSYDQLVQWGAADVNNQLFNTPDFALESQDVAVGVGAGVGTAAAITGLSLATTVATAVGGGGWVSSAGTALFPFAASIGVTVAGVAALALIAIAGAIAIGFYSVALFNASQVPDELATLITNAKNTTPDLAGMVGNSTELQGLYSLFIGATLPTPSAGSCSVEPILNDVGCLNAPSIPGASLQSDPIFKVQLNSGTANSPILGDPSYSSTISWKSTIKNNTGGTENLETTGRLHEVWFVDTVDDTTANTTSNVQSLRIHYTDWDGNEQTAWLFDWPTVGYTFVAIKDQDSSGKALNPNTCVSDKTCSYASYIDYVGTDGKNYRAYVIPAPVPAIDSVTVPNSISEGAAAQFDATAHSPIDDTLSYSWQFEDKSPGRFCLPSPCYANAVSGQNPTWTFPTSGTFDAILTVTDSGGRFATKSFTVPVSDVAPSLSIYPSCSPLFPCLHSNTFTEPLGTQTSLGGEIIHAGTEDTEKLDVNWGDGTDEFNMTNTLQCPFLNSQNQCSSNIAFDFADGSTDSSDIHLPFDATHTYAASGTYTVTVTVTDQSGGMDTKSFTETVLPLTTTTLSSAPDPSAYGQLVTFTAAVAAQAPDTGTPTGTVDFYEGTNLIGSGTLSVVNGQDRATFTTGTLSVATHTITATYEGDSNFASSTTTTGDSQIVNKGTTTTAIASSLNPSMSGMSVTFTATITITKGAGTPTGTVDFQDNGSDVNQCNQQPVSTSGGITTATCKTSSLPVAVHSMTAVYSGDTDFVGSASDDLVQRVLYDTRHFSAPAYHIGATNDYCANGGGTCVPVGKSGVDCNQHTVVCPSYTFASAEFFGPNNGTTSGTPVQVYLQCTEDTVGSQQTAIVNVVSPAGVSSYGASGLLPYSTANSGTIGGKASLVAWSQYNNPSDTGYPEVNPSQGSSVSVSAFDQATGARASVTGIQNTNNGNDLSNSGDFRITITGPTTVYSFGTHTTSTRTETMSCTAGGPNATAVYNANPTWYLYPPSAQGELENYLPFDPLN